MRNLKELRKNPDARHDRGRGGDLRAGAAGRDRPALRRRQAAGRASSERPVAELEIGKVGATDRRYVRPVGGAGHRGRRRPAARRGRPARRRVARAERHGRAEFQVASVKITAARTPAGQGAAGHPGRAEPPPAAGSSRAPIDAPANGPKVESLLGALSSLRVAEPPKGYVADDVKDLARFGLAKPADHRRADRPSPTAARWSWTSASRSRTSRSASYVRQGGQDDVVMVEARALSEIPADATALRSQRGRRHRAGGRHRDRDPDLAATSSSSKKERGGWELTSPRKERADARPSSIPRPHRRAPDERVPRAAGRSPTRCSTRR